MKARHLPAWRFWLLAVALAAIQTFVASVPEAAEGATATLLPENFLRRPDNLLIDPYDAPGDHRAITPIRVRAEQPGELSLRDASGEVVARDRGAQPAIVHDWRHDAGEPVPDTVFTIQFTPNDGQPGTRRLLRVRAGEAVNRVFGPGPDGQGWQMQPTEANTFMPSGLERASGQGAALIEAPEDLERELAALLALEEPADPVQRAGELRAAGQARILEGDYEAALELLEQSLALSHDAALADRIERLRLFLEVRSAPGQEAGKSSDD
ncbi:MAG: hypothetical protein ACLFSG_01905 [Halothiobacillaceae bacterium]